MLSRVSLIKELDEYKNEKPDRVLNRIKNILILSETKSDKNFITLGRREELFNEFNESINNIPLTDDDIKTSFNAIKDYIHGQSWIEMDETIEVKDYKDKAYREYNKLLKKNEAYKESNNISTEEKNILLNMIDTFLTKIKY